MNDIPFANCAYCHSFLAPLRHKYKHLEMARHILASALCERDYLPEDLRQMVDEDPHQIVKTMLGITALLHGQRDARKAFGLGKMLSFSKRKQLVAAGEVKKLTFQGIPERKAIAMVLERHGNGKGINVTYSQLANTYNAHCRYCLKFQGKNKGIQAK